MVPVSGLLYWHSIFYLVELNTRTLIGNHVKAYGVPVSRLLYWPSIFYLCRLLFRHPAELLQGLV